MTEEIIIDKEDKTKKHRNNEIDCLHFSCRKGESGKVLLWCGFYDDYCDNYTGCYYRKYLRLEKENENLKKEVKQIGSDFIKKGDYARELEQENKELKDKITVLEDKLQLRMASDKESDAFWDEIFSEKDYPFNKENAYKELRDYYFVLEQIPKIYMEITGGTLSKTTYFASSVIQAYNDALERYYDKIDDLEYDNNAYRSALEEIRKVINLAYKTGDYLLGQDYTDLVDTIEKELEVLND